MFQDVSSLLYSKRNQSWNAKKIPPTVNPYSNENKPPHSYVLKNVFLIVSPQEFNGITIQAVHSPMHVIWGLLVVVFFQSKCCKYWPKTGSYINIANKKNSESDFKLSHDWLCCQRCFNSSSQSLLWVSRFCSLLVANRPHINKNNFEKSLTPGALQNT